MGLLSLFAAKSFETGRTVTQMLSGDEIRAAYAPKTEGVDIEGRVIRYLTAHGASTTRQVVQGGFNNTVKYSSIRATLARLTDEGRIVATAKPTTAQGGRPGITWQIA